MGNYSVVSGFIHLRDEPIERAKETIDSFEFDDVWPFTNIFWCDSPAHYFSPVVGFAGSYKQVEEVWSEWLWKFSQLLTRLDAHHAQVHLSCVMGNHSWQLRPKVCAQSTRWPKSMIGEPWVITSAPENDFSIDPGWLHSVEHNLANLDKETGKLIWYKWDKFVERVPIS